MATEAIAAPPALQHKVVMKFIHSLATQLSSDRSLNLLSSSNSNLQDLLRKAAEDLPAGKLRSRLLLIQQDPSQLDAFIASLRENIRTAALSSQPADASFISLKDKRFERISNWFVENTVSSSPFSFTGYNDSLSPEERQFILWQEPPADIIWTIAAAELSSHVSSLDAEVPVVPKSARTLFVCLKSLVVGHRSPSVAIATLAPVVPMLLHCLQQTSNRNLHDIKLLHDTVKEALSFISIVNDRDEKEVTDEAANISVTDLLDIFSSIFQALKFEVYIQQIEAQLLEGKLRLIFPLVPMKLIEKISKSEVAIIRVLAKMVRMQLLVLQMVLELIYRKERQQVREKSKKLSISELTRMVGFVAVNGLAAAERDKDLLLDLVLSGFSVGAILTEEEMNVIQFSLYKALIIAGQGFTGNTAPGTAREKKKEITKFLKKIMVARMIRGKRLNDDHQNNVEEVTRKICVPHGFSEHLNSKRTSMPPENALQNDWALIGWLLHLADSEFQTLMESSSNSCINEDTSVKKQEHSELAGSLDLEDTFREAENLFFLDTAGETEIDVGKADVDTVGSAGIKKKSRKRKQRKIQFQRHALLVGEEKIDCPSDNQEKNEISSHSSSDEMISDIEISELKRHKDVSECTELSL